MYPYRSRLRWFVFGRYSHLVHAIEVKHLAHPTLRRRLSSLRAWNTARFGISVLLSVGIVATALSAASRFIPGGAEDDVVERITAITSALTGFVTLVYLFLTRLLAQIEIDILTILTLERPK